MLENLATSNNPVELRGPRNYPEFPVLKNGKIIDAQLLLKGESGLPGFAGPKGAKGDLGFTGMSLQRYQLKIRANDKLFHLCIFKEFLECPV